MPDNEDFLIVCEIMRFFSLTWQLTQDFFIREENVRAKFPKGMYTVNERRDKGRMHCYGDVASIKLNTEFYLYEGKLNCFQYILEF